MQVHNKEYGLLLTVAAADKIIKLCPNGELSKINSVLFSNDLAKNNEFAVAFICALSEGFESAKAFETPGYTPDPVTPQMLLSVTLMEFYQLRNEAVLAFNAGLRPTVDVEESKKNESPALA